MSQLSAEDWESDLRVIAEALRFYARHEYLTEDQKDCVLYLRRMHIHEADLRKEQDNGFGFRR